MSKAVFAFFLFVCSFQLLFAELPAKFPVEAGFKTMDKTPNTEEYSVPFFSTLFYQFGLNTLHSFTYNYGVPYLLAGLGTYYMVHSGIDWEWNRIALNHHALAYAGTPFGAMGFIAPVAVPLGLYFYGKNRNNAEYQIVGLAIGQAAIQGVLISSSIKAFTGRRSPGIFEAIITGDVDNNDYSGDFAFGFMERGVFSGWPSSHTTVAFAMAVTLAELYPSNTALKIGAYSYAALIGFGMSLFAHWASESVAGALIGFSIGKSVGRSYKQLLDKRSAPGSIDDMPGFKLTEHVSFSFLPSFTGLNIRY
jgi:membrane-associated phospholipid phosphatase